MNLEQHAVPHSRLEEDLDLADAAVLHEVLTEWLPRDPERLPQRAGELFPHALYSFPNYPDGLLRTSVRQMAKHVLAIMHGGALPGDDGARILEEDTVAYMLSQEHYGRGLGWVRMHDDAGAELWGHDGSDPGVSTRMAFRPADRFGVLVFVNGDGGDEVLASLFLDPPTD